MGAIVERSTVTLELCRNYAKVSGTAEDETLEFLLKAAKEAADAYCGNEFLDEDGEELDIPAPIERWILQQVVRDFMNRSDGIQIESVNQVSFINWSKRDYTDLFQYRSARLML